ncbi:allose kinase [Candidatus Pacearchaeota archaeon]|jgi:allose kinase|nr:allose kinase [Candidatus Pacearchaeota archaeon]
MTKDIVLGIDIGGTNLRLAIVDHNLNLINKRIIEISFAKENINFIDELIKIVYDYLNYVNRNIKAIGIGVPGIVNKEGDIISCPNSTDLENSNLKSLFEQKFAVPVFIEKDVNLIVLAEYKKLNKDIKNVVGCFIGTGFGCSIIINGKLYKGTRGFAGELGHIHLKGKKKHCNCGSKGCLELYAAGNTIEILAKKRNVSIKDFFLKIDKESLEIRELLDNIAIGISTIVNLLDPELIVIGGGVVNMANFPLDALKKRIYKYLRSDILVGEVKIIKSNIGKFGGCLGAGIYYYSKLY